MTARRGRCNITSGETDTTANGGSSREERALVGTGRRRRDGGHGVQPIVHRQWDGGVIELPRQGTRLDPAAMPEMTAMMRRKVIVNAIGNFDGGSGISAVWLKFIPHCLQ